MANNEQEKVSFFSTYVCLGVSIVMLMSFIVGSHVIDLILGMIWLTVSIKAYSNRKFELNQRMQ